MKKKISKLMCIFTSVLITIISCMPICYALDYYDNYTDLYTAIDSRFEEVIDEFSVEDDSVVYKCPSEFFMGWYGICEDWDNYYDSPCNIGYITYYSIAESDDIDYKSLIKLYYDDDLDLFYYGTDDDLEIFYYKRNNVVVQSSGYAVTFNGESVRVPTSRIYVGGYDIDGIEHFNRLSGIYEYDDYTDYSYGISDTLSLSKSYYFVDVMVNLSRLEYGFVPEIDESVPNADEINFDDYLDWSQYYDDIDIDFKTPYDTSDLTSLLWASLPTGVVHSEYDSSNVDINFLDMLVAIFNKYALTYNDLTIQATITNHGNTDFSFFVTSNSVRYGNYYSGSSSFDNSTSTITGMFGSNGSCLYTVSAGDTLVIDLSLSNIQHDTSKFPNYSGSNDFATCLGDFYFNFWSKEAYRVQSLTSYINRNSGIAEPSSTNGYMSCYSKYYWYSTAWTDTPVENDYTDYYDEINNSVTGGKGSAINYSDSQHTKAITNTETTQNTITNSDGTTSTEETIDYSNKLSSVITLLIQIREGIYDLPTQFTGLFDSLETAVDAVPDAVDTMQTAVVGAVAANANTVVSSINAGFTSLSADISAMATNLGDLSLIANDIKDDTDTMTSDVGDIATATYSISNYYTAESDTSSSDDSSSSSIDTNGTIVTVDTSDNEYQIADFSGLITYCSDYLGFFKDAMNAFCPSWCWLLIASSLTAVVVMRFVAR